MENTVENACAVEVKVAFWVSHDLSVRASTKTSKRLDLKTWIYEPLTSLKIDGWKMTFLVGFSILSVAMFVSGSVTVSIITLQRAGSCINKNLEISGSLCWRVLSALPFPRQFHHPKKQAPSMSPRESWTQDHEKEAKYNVTMLTLVLLLLKM